MVKELVELGLIAKYEDLKDILNDQQVLQKGTSSSQLNLTIRKAIGESGSKKLRMVT